MKATKTVKPITDKITSKVREGSAKLKAKMGARTSSAKTTMGKTAKTTSIPAKTAISRTPAAVSARKTAKKPVGSGRVSTVHLIGKRGSSARTTTSVAR